MTRKLLLAATLLAASCGPEPISDASLSREANRIAVDLQGDWNLYIANACNDGSGELSVASTLAWFDTVTNEAGVNGTGPWNCGAESGTFSLVVGIDGRVAVTLHRASAPGSPPWTGTGTYAPQDMAGALAPPGGTPCVTCSWSAHHR